MNNLLSHCGLVDPRISASDKDLPVLVITYLNLNVRDVVSCSTSSLKGPGQHILTVLMSIFLHYFPWRQACFLLETVSRK
jgi:hypothetical protein